MEQNQDTGSNKPERSQAAESLNAKGLQPPSENPPADLNTPLIPSAKISTPGLSGKVGASEPHTPGNPPTDLKTPRLASPARSDSRPHAQGEAVENSSPENRPKGLNTTPLARADNVDPKQSTRADSAAAPAPDNPPSDLNTTLFAGAKRSESRPHARTEGAELSAPELSDRLFSHRADHARSLSQSLSFNEYLAKVIESPKLMIRNESQYTVDMMLSFGSEPKTILGREILDFRLKHRPWQPQELEDQVRLFGQEAPLYEFFLRCQLYARQAHPNRMIVLHGPPGGGKTLMSETLSAGLEEYSKNNPEGVLYRLTFGFESDKQRRALGFKNSAFETIENDDTSDSNQNRFRFIIRPPGNTDPIFLIPKDAAPGDTSPRVALLKSLYDAKKIDSSFNASYLLRGELDSTSERIMEALLDFYGGDLKAVLENHIRVERWTMSAKLGRGITAIRPSQDWNADIEPHQNHYHMGSPTPPQLDSAASEIFLSHALPLATSRGHLHFADLLRPNERDRGDADISRLSHLLETIEGGTTQIMSRRESSLVRTEQIHTLIRADSNDEHIEIKRTGPAWKSFSQRCDFITVGLTTRFLEEAEAHKQRLTQLLGEERPLAPHALNTFALFVTATRLLKPDSASYTHTDKDLPEILKDLHVVEKALLLQEAVSGVRNEMNIFRAGEKRWSVVQLTKLKRHIPDIAAEYMHGVGFTRFTLYDGGIGVSTRAAQDLLKEIIGTRQTGPLTVVDVCEALNGRKDFLEYYQEIGNAKEQFMETEFKNWMGEQRTQGKSPSDRDIASERLKIRRDIERRFPIPHPGQILHYVKEYARLQVQEDVYQALGMANMESMALRLGRYLEHVRVSVTKNGSVRPEFRVPKGGRNEDASKELMEDFEDRVLEQRPSSPREREEFRANLIKRIASWRLSNPTEEYEGNLENIFSDLRDKIKGVQQRWLEQAVSSFIAQSAAYENNPQNVEKHRKGSPEQKKAVADWERASNELIEAGYPKGSISRQVIWAFTKDSEDKK